MTAVMNQDLGKKQQASSRKKVDFVSLFRPFKGASTQLPKSGALKFLIDRQPPFATKCPDFFFQGKIAARNTPSC